MTIDVPKDVVEFVRAVFANCNDMAATSLSTFPGVHEEALDMSLIGYLASNAAPLKLPSNWLVTIAAHFIGGGRHFGTWEVADIGLMIVFRKSGRVVRSKLCFIQSKKLYAASARPSYEDRSSLRRMGLGRLVVSDAEHSDLVSQKTLRFSKASRYVAFEKDSDQQDAMRHYQERWATELFYLFYNPRSIPHQITMPLLAAPEFPANFVGCRVAPKFEVDAVISSKPKGYKPSYADFDDGLGKMMRGVASEAGWRLEDFVADLVLKCKAGTIDDSPNFETLLIMMNQKSRPISCAISLTFDAPG